MTEIICPHCKNPIYDEDALLCHFCGESLNRRSSGAMGKVRNKWILWAAAGLILAAFILLSIL